MTETICKQCGGISTNGTNFCSRKCKKKWMEAHNYTYRDWKRVDRRNARALLRMSGGVDMEDFGDKREVD